jgi:hypothetical protein
VSSTKVEVFQKNTFSGAKFSKSLYTYKISIEVQVIARIFRQESPDLDVTPPATRHDKLTRIINKKSFSREIPCKQ